MREPFRSRFAASLRAGAQARDQGAREAEAALVREAESTRVREAEAALAREAEAARVEAATAREALERVQTLSSVARGAWFGLIGYLAFVGLTLLGVRDVDFFALDARTQLPLVGVAIPTRAFFWASPLLGLALHAWLHLHLVKLWDALADAPPTVAGRPLGDRVFPWLATDWALRLRPGGEATTRRPLDRLGDLVTEALVWWAAPLLIIATWWRSMPAREEWLTLPLGVMASLAVYVSARSRRRARVRLGGGVADERLFARRGALAGLVVVATVVGWLRTEGGVEQYAVMWSDAVLTAEERGRESVFPSLRIDRQIRAEAAAWLHTADVSAAMRVWAPCTPTAAEREGAAEGATLRERLCGVAGFDPTRFGTLAPLDLRGADLARRPADWVSRETAERRFRVTWCRDRGIPPYACHVPRPDDFQGPDREAAIAAERAAHQRARAAWCGLTGTEAPDAACTGRFAALEGAFAEEWREQRDGVLENLAKPAMAGRDLRGADLSGAFLARLDLREARMEGAVLRDARMEGTVLIAARMEGAILVDARMEGADLSWARMERANFSRARMDWAIIMGARMNMATLRWARINWATLTDARLKRADLRDTKMEWSNLSRARLEGADLERAQLQSINWAGATLGASFAPGADFSAAKNLSQSQLDEGPGGPLIGGDKTRLPYGLHVWNCWETRPPNFILLQIRRSLPPFFIPSFSTMAEWLCSQENPRRRVGRAAVP